MSFLEVDKILVNNGVLGENMDVKGNSLVNINKTYKELCVKLVCSQEEQKAVAFILGFAFLAVVAPTDVFAGAGGYGQACNKLLGLIEGAFGALVAAAAGVAAILAAALGGFKMAWSLVVVSIGSFILRSFITLFNGSCGASAGGIAGGILN